jgi:hypothetical protein
MKIETQEVSKKCWCRSCAPPSPFEHRLHVCPICRDKRCIHAMNHHAPCAQFNSYKHNAWVEMILLRVHDYPDAVRIEDIVSLGHPATLALGLKKSTNGLNEAFRVALDVIRDIATTPRNARARAKARAAVEFLESQK